jgi:hypothetical protein
MTILVDQARWPWRDTYWCHLVSDSDLAELHEFAGRLGCRRVGFQGDHYDIDVVTRDRAIELGAIELDSRELVRRMKAAGLRLRPSQFTKWSLVTRGENGSTLPDEFVSATIEHLVDEADGYFVLARDRADGTSTRAVIVYGNVSIAMLAEDPDRGQFFRIDIDGNWSAEVFTPPPTSAE